MWAHSLQNASIWLHFFGALKGSVLEKILSSTDTMAETELRTSSNNMLCLVTYEPLPKEEQEEIEQLLAVGE